MKNASKKNLPPLHNEQDTDLLAPFEYLSDVADRINELVEQAKTGPRKEKMQKLEEAEKLARAYEKHCGRDKLFKKFI